MGRIYLLTVSSMLRLTYLRHYSLCSFRSYHVTPLLKTVRLLEIHQLSTYINLVAKDICTQRLENY